MHSSVVAFFIIKFSRLGNHIVRDDFQAENLEKSLPKDDELIKTNTFNEEERKNNKNKKREEELNAGKDGEGSKK